MRAEAGRNWIERTDGMVHVLNAPSPGATASLAIGRVIAEMALESLGGGAVADGVAAAADRGVATPAVQGA